MCLERFYTTLGAHNESLNSGKDGQLKSANDFSPVPTKVLHFQESICKLWGHEIIEY
jgi:hypothetical protein